MSDPLLFGLTTGGAFLLSFLLFTNPKNTNAKANSWLAAFVFTLACAMLEIFLHNLELTKDHRVTLGLIEASRFLSAPTLYLSVSFFTSVGKNNKAGIVLHFMLFLAAFIFLLPNIATGENFQFSNQLTARRVLTFFKISLPAQTVIYWCLSYLKLRRHEQNIRQIASDTNEIDLSWLKNFLWILAAIVLIWLNLAIFSFRLLADFTPILYLISIYFLAYFALKQREIYPYKRADLQELDMFISAKTNTQTEKQKRLTESQSASLREKLERLMHSEKVYLKNDLSLPMLAEQMGVSIHELSYLINNAYSENFFSFVNRHRIEEAKRLLISEKFETLNILGIAFEAGFNSKTTFNTAFKKSTGMSPSEFALRARK